MQTKSKKPGAGSKTPSKGLKKAKSKSLRDDPAQSRAFIEKAKELEADHDDAGADALLGALAKKPPKPHK